VAWDSRPKESLLLQEEFSLIARLLISSGARDVPSLGKMTMITLYRR